MTLFEEFCRERFEAPPWDHPENIRGFRPEIPNISSDISAHTCMLAFLAARCSHVTEFGTRFASSTAAFLSRCRGKVVSYDICVNPVIRQLQAMNSRGELPCEYVFHQQDTTDPSLVIEPTDLLFLDTLHVARVVRQELSHAHKVRRWICMHDTTSQAEESVDRRGEPGIMPAVRDFLEAQPHWFVDYKAEFNHGLLVLANEKYF